MLENTTILQNMRKAVDEVIIGKSHVTEMLQTALLCGGHVLLEDVPGTGKTKLAKSFSRLINGSFRRIQFTPDLMPTDVTGFHYFNQKTAEFELREGPVMTNILLADEINRATPRSQASLLEVMEENQVTIDGSALKLPEPFMVMATQNPVESRQGNFPLPEAQLDRFLLTVKMGYPAFEEERKMIQTYKHEREKEITAPVSTIDQIKKMKKEVEQVSVNEPTETYILQLVEATRMSPDVTAGVSPRGTLALMKAGQALAYIRGKTFVSPEEIKSLAPNVLSHRLVLTLEGSMKKTKISVIEQVLHDIPVPVEEGFETQ